MPKPEPKSTRRQLEREIEDLRRIILDSGKEPDNVESKSTFELEELAHVLSRGAGYIRIGYNHKTRTYWVRWKWTANDYADHYVLCSSSGLAHALIGCIEQVWAVESGKKKPTRDTGYGRR